MSIIHHKAEQQFIFMLDDLVAGKLLYRYLSEQKIDAFHTKVDKAFQGKGIAGELYLALIDFAKEENLKIKPSCSYIEKRMLKSHPEFIA